MHKVNCILAMALSVCFRFMSLTVPLVSFVPLLRFSIILKKLSDVKIKHLKKNIYSINEYGWLIGGGFHDALAKKGYIFNVFNLNLKWQKLDTIDFVRCIEYS